MITNIIQERKKWVSSTKSIIIWWSMLSKRSLRDETLKNRCRIVSTGDVTRVRSNRSSFIVDFVPFNFCTFFWRKVCERAWFCTGSSIRKYELCARVRVYNPHRVKGRSVKWQSFFSIDGRVERRINDATYLVKADRWRGSKVVHVDKIKPLLTFQPV